MSGEPKILICRMGSIGLQLLPLLIHQGEPIVILPDLLDTKFKLDDIGPRGTLTKEQLEIMDKARFGHSHFNNTMIIKCIEHEDLPQLLHCEMKKHNKGKGKHKVKSWERPLFGNYKKVRNKKS